MTHWENYYKESKAPTNASLFAHFVLTKLPESKLRILDLGCGNGRDAYFFGSHGHQVTGIDLNVCPESNNNCKFMKASMANLPEIEMDIIYSRFSLHSVSESIEDYVLQWSRDHLTPNGMLFIEARSTNDNLNGTGEKVGSNEFLGATSYADAHYRRFINLNEMSDKLKALNFKIDHASESDEYAPYKDQRPSCVRFVCTTPIGEE